MVTHYDLPLTKITEEEVVNQQAFSHSVFGHLSASHRDNDYQGSNI